MAMRLTYVTWMLAICLGLPSCGANNPDISKSGVEIATNSSEAALDEERHRNVSVERLRQIADRNLQIGLKSSEVGKALKAHDLSVIAMAGSGVSATKCYGTGTLSGPVLAVTFRREDREFHVSEWAVEDVVLSGEDEGAIDQKNEMNGTRP